MSRLLRFAILPLLLLILSPALATAPASAGQPLPFVANEGQFDPAVLYHARLSDGALWLTDGALWLSRIGPATTAHFRLSLPAGTEITPGATHPTRHTYRAGPAPAYRQLTLEAPDGRRLVLAGRHGRLALEPGPGWPLDAPGASLIPTAAGWRLDTPAGPLYLDRISSATPSQNQSLQFATFIGGALTEEGTTVAGGDGGATFIAGYTSSLVFPAAPGVVPSHSALHGVDVYVARVAPDGATLDYLLWINADQSDDEDYATAIAVDAAGRAVVAGHTRSPAFCEFVNPAPGFDTSYNGNTDAFLFRVNAAGTALEYCTYLGGNDLDRAMALALDTGGNAYIGGGTSSTDFPTTDGSLLTGARDAFIAKVNASGTSLMYATLAGGSGQEEVRALGVDAGGSAFAAGWTRSADFPATAGAFDTTANGGADAFALRLSGDGLVRLYATYLGGAAEDFGYGLALDDGDLFVTGETGSADFPTTPNAFDVTHGGGTCDFAPCPDAFALRLNGAGSALTYATFLGGAGADIARAAALEGDGRLHLTGQTTSPAFPTTPGAFDTTLGGDADAFHAVLAPSGTALAYGSFLGAADTDEGYGLALLPGGDVALGGKTRSPAFPTTPGAFDTSHNGDYDIYVVRLRPDYASTASFYLPVIMQP